MPLEQVQVNGNPIGVDLVDGLMVQVLKMAFGTDGALTLVSSADPMPVYLAQPIQGGANNIGDVDVVSLPGSLSGVAPDASYASQAGIPMMAVRKDAATTIASADGKAAPLTVDNLGRLRVATLVSARANDSMAAGLQTDAIMNGNTPLTPKFAKANVAAASTDANVVTAVSGKKIRVVQFRVTTGSAASNITFNSKPAGAGTAVSETMQFPANGGISSGMSPYGHFESAAGEGLTVTTTGATTNVGIVYVEV